jgi:DNA-binding Lrp family transcriptional regulator
MPDADLPDWTTEMDREILEMLTIDWELTPAVIADNIGRSREAVSRRLNTLDAGGLVEKTGRGKYRISEEAVELVEQKWTKVESIEDQQGVAALEGHLQRKQIRERLGISVDQYQNEVIEEYKNLWEETEDSSPDLLSKAFKIVDERHT